MATIQSEVGQIRIFDDFIGPEWTIAETADDSMNLGMFRIVGQGIAEVDSGITVLEADPNLNGVASLTTTDEDLHSCGLVTAKCLDVGLMAPFVLETRVQFPDLDTKEFFFGLSDYNDDAAILEGGLVHIATTVITNTASDFCGFHFSSEATDSTDWHMVYNGGTTVATVLSTDVDADDVAVAGEWQVLRLEVDPNGMARWYIDGVLKKTLAGAVSTSVDLALVALLQSTAAEIQYAKLDYILLLANRDWTV